MDKHTNAASAPSPQPLRDNDTDDVYGFDGLFGFETVPFAKIGQQMRTHNTNPDAPVSLVAQSQKPPIPGGINTTQTRLSVCKPGTHGRSQASPLSVTEVQLPNGIRVRTSVKSRRGVSPAPAPTLSPVPPVAVAAAEKQETVSPVKRESIMGFASVPGEGRRRSTGFDYTSGLSMRRPRVSNSTDQALTDQSQTPEGQSVEPTLPRTTSAAEVTVEWNGYGLSSYIKSGRRRASSADSVHTRQEGTTSRVTSAGARRRSSDSTSTTASRATVGRTSTAGGDLALEMRSVSSHALGPASRRDLLMSTSAPPASHRRPSRARGLSLSSYSDSAHSETDAHAQLAPPPPPAILGFRATVVVAEDHDAVNEPAARHGLPHGNLRTGQSLDKPDPNVRSVFADSYDSSSSDAPATNAAYRKTSDENGDAGYMATSMFRPPTAKTRPGSRPPSAKTRRDRPNSGGADFLASSVFRPSAARLKSSTRASHEEEEGGDDNFLAASVFRPGRGRTTDHDDDDDDDDDNDDDVASIADAFDAHLRRTGGGLPQQWKALANVVGKLKTQARRARQASRDVDGQRRQPCSASPSRSETSSTGTSGHLSLLSAIDAHGGVLDNFTTSFFDVPEARSLCVATRSLAGSHFGSASEILDIHSDDDEEVCVDAEDCGETPGVSFPSPAAHVPVPRLDARLRQPSPLSRDALRATPVQPAYAGMISTQPVNGACYASHGCAAPPLPPWMGSLGNGTGAVVGAPPCGPYATAPTVQPEWLAADTRPGAGAGVFLPQTMPPQRAMYAPVNRVPQPQPNLEGPKLRKRAQPTDLWARRDWRLEDAPWVDSPTEAALGEVNNKAKADNRRAAHKRRNK